MDVCRLIVDYIDTTDPCGALYLANYDALRRLATRAQETGRTHETHVIVAIDADDMAWSNLRDALMPGHDWDAYRRRGEKPVARGIVPKEVFADLLATIPTVRKVVERVPMGTHIALLFANGHVMARDIV